MESIALKIVKNIGKNRSHADSLSASDAAAHLGVSIPTLKRMVADGRLESFRTPGGHVRILAESLETLPEAKRVRFRSVRDASPVLQNRRERLEELTLEAQEIRARRELSKLQREEEAEAEQQEAEEQAREREDAQRQAEIELQREQLEHEQAQELARKQAARKAASFRREWLNAVNQVLSDPQSDWLSEAEKKQIADTVATEIEARRPSDAALMTAIVTRTVAVLIEAFQQQRKAQKQRQRAIEAAVGKLSFYATDQEKNRATNAAREAIQRLMGGAEETDLRIVAEDAVEPIHLQVERRLLRERLLQWALLQLPWGKTELDALRVRRECLEILAELPEDFSEVEAKEALAPTIKEACLQIERRINQQQLTL